MSGSSMIRRMFEKGTELKKIHGADRVYDFSIGNPVPEPPPEFSEKIKSLLSQPPAGRHMYINNSGTQTAREHIAAELKELTGQDYGPGDITLCCGAAGGLNILMKSILGRGDEVIVIAPYFPEYFFYIGNHGGKMVTAKSDNQFMPDLDDLSRQITPRTKAVIINTPNNPTGAVYPCEVIKQLADLLTRKSAEIGHPIMLINDEPYRNIIFNQSEPVFISLYYPHTVNVYSYSKELGIPGERIGYVAVGPECESRAELAGALNFSNRILGFVNAPALMQYIIPLLKGVQVDFSFYRHNRDMFYDILTESGFRLSRPDGAFYFFPQTPVQDDLAFCEKAVDYNILLVPGRTFGAPGYCRIAYCMAPDTIRNSRQAFIDLFGQYR